MKCQCFSLILLVCFFGNSEQQTNGSLTIVVEPSSWLNYSNINATVTFSLDPPCSGASIFRTEGSLQVCVFGPACPYNGIVFSKDLNGNWLKVENAVSLKSGLYHVQCPMPPDSVRIYTTSGTQDNLIIGVNPSILKIAVEPPEFNLTRRLDKFSNPDAMAALSGSTITVKIGVGNGILPYPVDSNPITIFQVVDFDLPGGQFSFAKRNHVVTDIAEIIPPGSWYSYLLSVEDLAKGGFCSVKGQAVAYLRGAQHVDSAYFHFNVSYSTRIGRILLKRNSARQGCECVFTCKAVTCPSSAATITRSEWAFTSEDPLAANYKPGNVLGRCDQYKLTPTECQDRFNLAKEEPLTFKISCRVYTDQSGDKSPASTHSESLYHLLRPCNQSEFECTQNLECIPVEKRCNGRNDCIDGTDEDGCEDEQCKFGEFNCNDESGACIPSYKMCDGEAQCENGYDEENCSGPVTPCAIGFYQCVNERCVRGRYVCDNDDDCLDGSDEATCGSQHASCSSGYLICKNGNCVHRDLVCNRNNDCGDNSDEHRCGNYYSDSCGRDHFHCKNGNCIFTGNLCDGEDDCGDFSDEVTCSNVAAGRNLFGVVSTTPASLMTQCSPGEFACKNGRCIDSVGMCNGYDDCWDDSDEGSETCASCPKSRFHCNNNRCVDETRLCDGGDDCGDSSDESQGICDACLLSNRPYPPMWRCETSKKCIHISQVCNSGNCGDGDESDLSAEACRTVSEFNSRPAECPRGTIKCSSTQDCVPLRSVCNGVVDCCSRNWQRDYENATHIGDCQKTDEIGCFRYANCSDGNNGGCQKNCLSVSLPTEPSVCGGLTLSTAASAYCWCGEGYTRPLSDMASCQDVDECKAPFSHNCSQICTNIEGSYKCSCVEGFSDDQRCEADTPPVLVFAFSDSLRLLNGLKMPILAQTKFANRSFSAVDVDIRDGTVIFAETGEWLLRRTVLPTDRHQNIVEALPLYSTRPLNNVVDIAIDFIGNNLYVADFSGKSSRIVVSLVDGRYQKVLSTSDLQITSIAVNPLKGCLYYATFFNDLRSGFPSTIIMTSMNGSRFSDVEIFRKRYGTKVRTISVDFLGQGRLYFTTGSEIIITNFDGSSNSSFSRQVFMPSARAFDVFGSFLFSVFTEFRLYGNTDQFRTPIYKLDKFDRSHLAVNLTQDLFDVSNIRVYHLRKAGYQSTWPDPCKDLACSHLCLLNLEGTATCACPTGTDSQNCSSAQVAAPDHPGHCQKTCQPGQGVCAKSRDGNSMKCTCFSHFSGRFCNETKTLTTIKPDSVKTKGQSRAVRPEAGYILLLTLTIWLTK